MHEHGAVAALRSRIPCLLSVIARKRPSENERKTVDVAKTIVQMKTRMNGSRTSGSWTSRVKFVKPT